MSHALEYMVLQINQFWINDDLLHQVTQETIL